MMESKRMAEVDSEIGLIEESEGDSLLGEEIIGCENPKVIEWEELQQELARLCSLSSALKKASEHKESLSQRIISVIEVRQKFLAQSNELDDMTRKLEARKLAMGDTMMQMKETMEDVKSKTELLGGALRSLLVASKKVYAAHEQLKEARRQLSGEVGYGNSKRLQKMLRMRQQHMIAQVNLIYPVRSLNEPISREMPDIHSTGDISSETQSSSADTTETPTDTSRPPPASFFTILNQQLTALPLKKASFFADKKEIQRSAVVLGYVAHAVTLIASYMYVPLRYPLRLGGSHSYIQDYAPSVEAGSSDSVVSPLVRTSPKPTEFPLFIEGQDSTRAAYAIFLLNKDLEQLLNFFWCRELGSTACVG
ncbi:hypothetical protein HPP92_016378 [Vanilla planifolia]|uniref:UV radiation resistance-associated gene protein n=1 Tax=Vanilla planifolia TaxID=51239 RepID=A0A835US07_VANPL|nr:hypothetical protein HPP92_016378 [Vanilla planifolia]